VDASPGQIVIDAGDMLARVTNGMIPATTHRVVNPHTGSGRSRYSLPFFAHPRSECDLSVLPHFVNDERPARTPPITAGNFLAQRLHEIGLA
jgi:isopenicillin N synthase-like dioxygenase